MISAALMPENPVADRGIVIRQIPEAGAENCRKKAPRTQNLDHGFHGLHGFNFFPSVPSA